MKQRKLESYAEAYGYFSSRFPRKHSVTAVREFRKSKQSTESFNKFTCILPIEAPSSHYFIEKFRFGMTEAVL